MTKEEIYEHLAQVYLGKKTSDKKKKHIVFSNDLKNPANVFLVVLVLGLLFYSLTAFLSRRDNLKDNIIFALNYSPIRLSYDLNEPYPQVKNFSLTIPQTDFSKYKTLNFSIRGQEDGYPNIIKVVLKNAREEVAFTHVDGVRLKWEKFAIPLEEFRNITDWMSLSEISFVLEAWNVDKKKGTVLIDDVCFAK